MYIPPGCVLLTAAVDRLAEARRTAGQTKDDGKHAAQVELMGEFYSGAISPLVVSRSGKNYKIRTYHWGGELASTWFEQGECVLTDGLVDPPLRMFHGKERAYIFVSEHDLQRLIAKQEVKQEAAPKQSGLPGRPTSKHLVLEKLNERIKANEIEATLDSEATWLRDWLGRSIRKRPSPVKAQSKTPFERRTTTLRNPPNII